MNVQQSSQPASERRLTAAIVIFAAIVPAVLMVAPALAGQLAGQLGLSPSQIGNLFSVELGVMSLATLPAHWWLPRTNWRLMALLAGLLFIIGNVASALTTDYHGLMAWRAVSAAGGGSLMVLCLSAASYTANKDRVYGLWVLGQLVLGAVGLAVLPALFEHFGLAVAYWLLAAWMLICLPLAGAFPSRRPAPRQRATSRSLPRFDALLGILAVLTFYIGLSAIWTFIGGIGKETGLSAQASGQVLSVATLFGIAGASAATLIGQRGSRRLMLFAGYLAMVVSIGLLYGTPELLRFVVAALVFKFTWTFVLPFVLATLADLDHTGNLMNYTNLMIGGGLAVGPAIAGRLIDATHSFDLLALYAGAVVVLSLLLILFLHRRVSVQSTSFVPATGQGEP